MYAFVGSQPTARTSLVPVCPALGTTSWFFILTMRKHAPIITALIFTSRSTGTWIPKLAVLVKTLFTNPDQYLEILPIVDISLRAFTCANWGKKKQTKKKTGISLDVNKSNTHWLYLHRINDSALTCRVLYNCQAVLFFLSLKCSTSVRFAFRNGTQERASLANLETSESSELTEKWGEAIMKVYTTFAPLSQGFFFLPSSVSDMLQVTAAALLWSAVSYNWWICSWLRSHFPIPHTITQLGTLPTEVFQCG